MAMTSVQLLGFRSLNRPVALLHRIQHGNGMLERLHEVFCQRLGQVALDNDAEHGIRSFAVVKQRLLLVVFGVLERKHVSRYVPVTLSTEQGREMNEK